LQGNGERKVIDNVPSAPVEAADPKAIEALVKEGVIVIPVAQNNNYLLANFVMAPNFSDSNIKLLLPLQKQLVWLKLGGTKITDASLPKLQGFSNLLQLDLNRTSVTDEGISSLKSLSKLQLLNLVGTRVTATGVLTLSPLKKLQAIYLYQTNVNIEGWKELKSAFPKTQLDTGGYVVPSLATDTMLVRPPKQTK